MSPPKRTTSTTKSVAKKPKAARAKKVGATAGSVKEKRGQPRRITIRDEKHGLPYSKGLLARSIMATGLSPSKAYETAQLVEDQLLAERRWSVTIQELRQLTSHTLLTTVGDEFAARFLKWQAIAKLDKPLVVLVGGTTGVGKSTIATEVAHRLGIVRIVSTDSIREVMRAVFSDDLMPALYNSSFNAWKALRVPVPPPADPVTIGFREQTAAVVVGIRALIERAIKEGVNLVVEGIHIVPGFMQLDGFHERAFVVPLIVHVADEDLHMSHFYIRELETEGYRPFERYRANFENIRLIGDYIEWLAREHEMPLIESRQLDQTISTALESIVNRVIAVVRSQTDEAGEKSKKSQPKRKGKR